MLAQSLAMIAHHDNDCVRIGASLLQESDQVAECRVGISNFAVVGLLVLLRIGRRRLVRIMRIEQVYPNKTWAGAMLFQPTFGVLNDFHTAPLDAPEALFGFRFGREVIVEIEASIESRREGAAVKNHSADEGCGLITLLLEQFRPGRVLWRKRDSKISHAVHAGQESSQDRGVR